MPRAIARIPFPGAFKTPRQLTVEDWAVLEAALGHQVPKRARKKIGSVVALLMIRIPVEKKALSVVQTRKKIKSFRNQARRLRESIWYHEALADFLADNLQLFRQSIKQNCSGSVLASLADSLDAVIANCDLAGTRLAEPDQHVEDGFFFTALAIMLRRICKANGLPFKIRKDTDKMSDEGQHSPFIVFMETLRERLALPPISRAAMANRIFRLEKRLPKRDGSKIKKIA
ncbi:MAG TPA: hypothetical protein VGJ26_21455 [Pirellulales bacterium]|jgi:hypothetical protein